MKKLTNKRGLTFIQNFDMILWSFSLFFYVMNGPIISQIIESGPRFFSNEMAS